MPSCSGAHPLHHHVVPCARAAPPQLAPSTTIFSYEGTKDYGAFLSFSAAIEYRAQLGEQAVLDYIHNLAVSGADVLVSKWGTRSLTPPDMVGAMLNVEVTLHHTTLGHTPAHP